MPNRKSPTNNLSLLQSCGNLFAGIDPAIMANLSLASRHIELSAQKFLFTSGAPISDAHFLISGSIKRAITLANGTEKVVELVRSPQLFALGEFFSANTYTSFAQALTPCVFISVEADVFRQQLYRDPTLTERLFERMAQRQCDIEFENASQHASTGAQRVMDYLLGLAGDRMGIAGETTVLLESSKKLIASRIGMAPESLSRTLHQLMESGAIVVDGRRVHIQNAALAIKGSDLGLAPMSFPRKSKKLGHETPHGVASAALVNLCGRQRFLSQRMAAAWIMIGRKLAPSAAKVVLRQSCDKFERHLSRLDNFDLDTSLATQLAHVKALWPGYRELLHNPESKQVYEMSEAMLVAADQLTYAAEQRAGTPECHRVNVAGRNRMLSTRITKLFLVSGSHVCEQTVNEQIIDSRREFEANSAALKAESAHRPDAIAQLRTVDEQWRQFTDAIDATNASVLRQGKKAHARAVIAAGEALLRHTDTTVKMFERLAD